MDRLEKCHLVHRCSDRRPATVPLGDRPGHGVDHLHDHAAVNGPEKVGVDRGHDLGQRCARSRGRAAAEVVRAACPRRRPYGFARYRARRDYAIGVRTGPGAPDDLRQQDVRSWGQGPDANARDARDAGAAGGTDDRTARGHARGRTARAASQAAAAADDHSLARRAARGVAGLPRDCGLVAYFRIDSVDAKPDGGRPEDGPGRNYLLVGSDSRDDLTPEQQAELGTGDVEGRRTDTILLMHVPDGGGDTVSMSIPRDSLVEIPGRGDNKINAAYAFGGPELLVQTVESSTGIRVDDYVEIGFAGFADLVDAVGGVEVCPPEPMVDPMANLNIPAGCQTLDGPTALGYVRSRATPLGDLDRVQRQREVIGKIADKAVSPMTVINPVRYWRTMFAGSDAVTVGEQTGPFDLARFALGMRQATGPDGRTLTVPVPTPQRSTASAPSCAGTRRRRELSSRRSRTTKRITEP